MFDLVRNWTNDLQIIDSPFHVPKTLTLTTDPLAASVMHNLKLTKLAK